MRTSPKPIVHSATTTEQSTAYQTAVRLDPNHADMQNNLALALVEPGRVRGRDRSLPRGHPAQARFRRRTPRPGKGIADPGAARMRPGIVSSRLHGSCRGHATCHVSLATFWSSLGSLTRRSGRSATPCAATRGTPVRWPGWPLGCAKSCHWPTRPRSKACWPIPLFLSNPAFSCVSRLAQALDARGEFDRAAELTIEANALQLADFRNRGWLYDPARHRLFIDKLIAAFSPAFFDQVRGFGIETERPVFIVGLPRSGTTLIEQILASHPRVHGAGELTLARRIFESLPGADIYGGMPFDYSAVSRPRVRSDPGPAVLERAGRDR